MPNVVLTSLHKLYISEMLCSVKPFEYRPRKSSAKPDAKPSGTFNALGPISADKNTSDKSVDSHIIIFYASKNSSYTSGGQQFKINIEKYEEAWSELNYKENIKEIMDSIDDGKIVAIGLAGPPFKTELQHEDFKDQYAIPIQKIYKLDTAIELKDLNIDKAPQGYQYLHKSDEKGKKSLIV